MWASVVHTFWPLSTHSSPSCSGTVLDSPATSEPAPGSLNSWHQISSLREERPQVALLLFGCPVGDDGGGAHAVADRVPHPAAGAPPSWVAQSASPGDPSASARGRRCRSGSARGQAAVNCSPKNRCAGVLAGGRSARRPSTSSSTFALMPHPIAVLCGHLLTHEGSGTRARTTPPARRPVRARRGRAIAVRCPRQGAGLRGVRGPEGQVPGAQPARRAEPRLDAAPAHEAAVTNAVGCLPRPPRHRALHLPTGASPDRLARRRRTTR